MSQLDLANVVTVSAIPEGAAIGPFNTSLLVLLTHEVPAGSFGSDGYKPYKNASEPTTDFGSDSLTALMANGVFSQKPNILTGSGQLIIVPFVDTPEQQTLTFSADPTSGSYKLNYGALVTALIAANSTAAQVQAALRLLAPLRSVTVTGSEATAFTVVFAGVHGDATLLTVTDNTLNGGITVTPATTVPGVAETLTAAIARASTLVQYCGVMSSVIHGSSEIQTAAAAVESQNKMLFVVQKTEASVDPGGALALLATGGFTHTRGLLYIGDAVDADSLNMQACYAGRGLSTNYSGSNTTQTMHLKDLATVQPDLSMTQAILNKAQTAGADVYASIEGVAKTFTSGANRYFDRVINLIWLVTALQRSGFNYLAQTGTKIPQTEDGISGLKGSYRNVTDQGVRNAYIAPGVWTSADRFGDPEDFDRNIQERGYYIYSLPVALQLKADREARKAPLIQIAIKEAGAAHSSDVIVNVNA